MKAFAPFQIRFRSLFYIWIDGAEYDMYQYEIKWTFYHISHGFEARLCYTLFHFITIK